MAYYTFQNAGYGMKQNEMNLYFVRWKICTLWNEKYVPYEMKNLYS